jgi:hypothetical protein
MKYLILFQAGATFSNADRPNLVLLLRERFQPAQLLDIFNSKTGAIIIGHLQNFQIWLTSCPQDCEGVSGTGTGAL